MKKNGVKAIAYVIAIASIINILTFGMTQKVEAASVVNKVSDLQVKRTERNEVTLTWSNLYSAKGYEIYMKEGKGKWKKYKSTDLNMLNVEDLKINTQYVFKVRAFEKFGKKNVYGAFSKKESIKLTKSAYMTDLFEPAGSHTNIDVFGNEAFTMCSVGYAKGFHTYYTNCGGITYNINGDFEKVEFVWGTYDTYHIGNLTVYGDDEILYNGTNDDGQNPQTVKLDVSGVTKLTFSFTTTTNHNSLLDGYTGVGNVKLTYR